MRRILIATTVISSLTTLPASAQDQSLWDLLHPDRLIESFLQQAIMVLRTQADVTYDAMDASLARGEMSVEGIRVDLPRHLTGVQGCVLTISSLDILGLDPFAIDTFTGTLALRGLEVPGSCLGPNARPVIGFLPQGRVQVSDMIVEFSYNIPSSGLTLQSRTNLPELAALEIAVDFDYIWARQADFETAVSARLSGASVTIENLGAWEVAAPLLPPPFTDPDQAAAAMQQTLGGMLASVGEPGDGTLPKASKAFVAAMAEGWGAFVTDPKRLVIESGFPASEPRVVDGDTIAAIDDSPVALIELLEPVVGSDRAAERAVLSADLVAQARDVPDSLSPEDRRMVGLALLTGDRAPRNPALAAALLGPLAAAGDGEAALALALSLRDRDPEAAYAQALAAGPSGLSGVRSLLDTLEGELPFGTVLRMQGAAPEPGATDLRAPAPEMRARAEAHLRGVGATRSLRSALIYASVAAARGDRAAQALLPAIDRAVPADGRDAWTPVAEEAAEIALDAWLSAGDR